MAKRVYEFRCPCCKAQLELDPDSGRARHLKPPEAGLDELVGKVKGEGERLTDKFEAAAQDAARQKDKLDDMFKDAFEKAKDDKEKPRNPFDNE